KSYFAFVMTFLFLVFIIFVFSRHNVVTPLRRYFPFIRVIPPFFTQYAILITQYVAYTLSPS
ncbi:MAG: hypothetical protein KAJ14_09990, partial [Candidatus Omnitrophica bacterium]|nr:hypothetical protein [Candidatus Omnitrophota bacterium]